MSRYVALLRGVSPMNANMAQLKACFETMGFANVKTLLSSGNVAFDAGRQAESGLATTIAAGMQKNLPRSFPVIVRSTAHLRALIETDPYAAFEIPANAKRVVTFLDGAVAEVPALPLESDGARILALRGSEVFTAYVPHQRGPVFMTLIEKTFGKNLTTRTWDTVKKCANA